ncbi:MAG: Bax inhibitor-1/YccA family protein [Candidatus Omnitrophica bacterium]|jgi:FtsH-binding integral membrane protein|nr:Bax inhibitor-1/YccA family protein [Candidatus Omnitrophota bacterium]
MSFSNPSFDLSIAKARESAFFAGVYRWMAAGLFITAASSFAVLAYPQLIIALFRNPFLLIGLMIAQVALVMWLSAKALAMPTGQAIGLFSLYAALNGLIFAPILVVYTGASIVTTLSVTAGTFIIFSVYGYVTKKDLSSIGSIAIVGLFGIILATIVNMFMKSPMLDWVITYLGVGIFIILIAVDTQRLKAIYQSGAVDENAVGRLAILGALIVYLDFINLFLFLLRIFGRQRN